LHDGICTLAAAHLQIVDATLLGAGVRLAELAVFVATPTLDAILRTRELVRLHQITVQFD